MFVVSWDQTRFIGAVGENTDHYTTSTAEITEAFWFNVRSASGDCPPIMLIRLLMGHYDLID